MSRPKAKRKPRSARVPAPPVVATEPAAGWKGGRRAYLKVYLQKLDRQAPAVAPEPVQDDFPLTEWREVRREQRGQEAATEPA